MKRLPASIAVVAVLLLSASSAEPRVKVVAHRGVHDVAGENTMAAFRRAIEMGCDYIEVDVRETRDGMLVLMHDRTVDRTTSGRGAVKDKTLAEIRRLRVGNRRDDVAENVPTLDQALTVCRGRIGVLIDNKAASPAKVVAAVRQCGMIDQVVVYASPAELATFKRLEPGIRIQSPLPADGRSITRLINELEPDTVGGHLTDWDATDVQRCRAAGVEVWVDVLGEADNVCGYRRALQLNADVIQTDWPQRAMRLLESAGQHRNPAR